MANLLPVVESWRRSCRNDFGFNLDTETFVKDLIRLIEGETSDLFVLEDIFGIYGFMGLDMFDSPIGQQRVANEHYWYVIPEKRGISALRFMPLAQKWAKEKGCSHLIMNASNLASDLHDKVCKIYGRFGFEKFETSFIKKV